MSNNYHSLIPDFKRRVKELVRETPADTEELLALPYPYVVPGSDKVEALYYWDAYLINLGLIKMRMTEQARHNVENLVFLLRHYGYVPASNHKSMLHHSHLPLLPWMVRDVYRATGDKEWLRRIISDVVKEFYFWTTKPHTTPTGLFRYLAGEKAEWGPKKATEAESGWINSPRFDDARNYNPIDLNAILYRNAKILFDLQIEAEGKGDQKLLDKSEQIKQLIELCWNEEEGFYYDNDFVNKQLSKVKTLAGFMPLFVEMIDDTRAARMQKQLKSFACPGGLAITDHNYAGEPSMWNYPLVCAPYIYFVVKGLCDFDYMEDAADIGTCWLDMVSEIYRETDNLWEWYNVKQKSIADPNSLGNVALMGWTAGTYIALTDVLGLD